MDYNSGIEFRTPLPLCGISPEGAIILILNMVALIDRKVEE
jgi:hypothetical protein